MTKDQKTDHKLGRPVSMVVLAYLGISLLALIISSYRAAFLPLTHDEAISCLMTVSPCFKDNLRDLITLRYVEASNHLLNTFVVILDCRLFGFGDLSLRLGSLGAHAIFLLFGYLAFRKFRPALGLALFAGINLNAFLLSYFSMARGYSLAMGLMMASLFFALHFITASKAGASANDWREGALMGALVTAALSVLANMTWLFYFVALCAALATVDNPIFQPRLAPRRRCVLAMRRLSPIAMVSVALAAATIPFFVLLHSRAKLFDGGELGILKDTVSSLVAYTFGMDTGSGLVVGLTVLFAGIAVVVPVLGLRRIDTKRSPMTVFACVVFTLCWALPWIAFSLGTSKLPRGRTALFLLPPFYLALGYILDDGPGGKGAYSRRWAGALVLLLVTVAPVAASLKLTRLQWFHGLSAYDADTEHMLADLSAAASRRAEAIRLGIDWEVEPSINWYLQRNKLAWILPVDRSGYVGHHETYYKCLKSYGITAEEVAKGSSPYMDYHRSRLGQPRDDHDFLYVHRSNLDRIRKHVLLRVIREYPVSGYVLLEPVGSGVKGPHKELRDEGGRQELIQ